MSHIWGRGTVKQTTTVLCECFVMGRELESCGLLGGGCSSVSVRVSSYYKKHQTNKNKKMVRVPLILPHNGAKSQFRSRVQRTIELD